MYGVITYRPCGELVSWETASIEQVQVWVHRLTEEGADFFWFCIEM